MKANWVAGTFVASAAAGPIVVGMIGLLALAASRMEPFWSTLSFLIFALVFAFPIGFAISLIPNVVGTAVLAWVGERYRAARHPLVWSATGFALGWAMGTMMFAIGGIESTVFGLTGTACALICHRGIDWLD